MGFHWHALVRDVLSLGFQIKDMFTRLDLAEMVAIVVAAPPSSSLRHFQDEGWSREAHLLANMAEQNAGLAQVSEPFDRPGLGSRQQAPDSVMRGDSMTWAEMDALEEARAKAGAAAKASGVASKTVRRSW